MWPFVLLVLFGLVLFIYLAKPFPPTHVRLAAGQPGSSLEAIGKQYAEYFKKHGVELELVTTAGAFNNLELLKQGKVDVAFSLGGIAVGKDAGQIETIGSIEYEPFWLFYRSDSYKEGISASDFFRSKNFSVNIPGSGTRHLAEKILALHGIDVNKSDNMHTLSSSESVAALRSGKIDGVFLTAGIDSKTITGLLAVPDVRIFDFSAAGAYVKRLKYLELLNLPHGAIELESIVPKQDVQMVATTTTILINHSLHPAIQHLFLNTARKIDHMGKTFFTRPGGFPAYTERDVPLSDIAEHFYDKGPPALEGRVPYWLASFFDQIWFMLFAAFAIGYPLVKILPNTRSLYTSFCMTDCFDDLTEIDHELMKPLTSEEFKIVLINFDLLEKRINELWVPMKLQGEFYNLKNSVEIVRNRTIRVKEKLRELERGHGEN